MTPLHERCSTCWAAAAALFFRMLTDRVGGAARTARCRGRDAAVADGDLGPGLGRPAHQRHAGAAAGAARRRRPAAAAAPARGPGRAPRPAVPAPGLAGTVGRRSHADPDRAADGQRRWSLLPRPPRTPTPPRAHALGAGRCWTARRADPRRGGRRTGAGRVRRGLPVLRAMEEAGRCRRGYFVEGLGGAQFALPGAVDRMRALADGPTAGTTELGRTGPWCWPRRTRLSPTGRRCPGRSRPGETPSVAPAGPQGGRAGRAGRRVAGAVRRARRPDPAVLDRRSGAAGARRGRRWPRPSGTARSGG